MADDTGAVESRVSQVRERLGSTIEEVGHRANVPARAREAAGRGAEKMREASSSMGSGDGSTAATVKPLAIALGSMAAGFLAGSLLPATSAEKERIGPVADDVKDVARNTMQEAVERGKDVAGEAMEVARTRATEEGRDLSSQAAGDMQQAAQNHS
ncbi:MAG TPA: DUF3618 domain-containing protein [Miltoncostaeaceae bacterium]|jgi:hypothetical protein|nr:DUF3618 domain-containing protein [Miltoncostaeaceae bacterium]